MESMGKAIELIPHLTKDQLTKALYRSGVSPLRIKTDLENGYRYYHNFDLPDKYPNLWSGEYYSMTNQYPDLYSLSEQIIDSKNLTYPRWDLDQMNLIYSPIKWKVGYDDLVLNEPYNDLMMAHGLQLDLVHILIIINDYDNPPAPILKWIIQRDRLDIWVKLFSSVRLQPCNYAFFVFSNYKSELLEWHESRYPLAGQSDEFIIELFYVHYIDIDRGAIKVIFDLIPSSRLQEILTRDVVFGLLTNIHNYFQEIVEYLQISAIHHPTLEHLRSIFDEDFVCLLLEEYPGGLYELRFFYQEGYITDSTLEDAAQKLDLGELLNRDSIFDLVE